jgi:hypothetical protein
MIKVLLLLLLLLLFSSTFHPFLTHAPHLPSVASLILMCFRYDTLIT